MQKRVAWTMFGLCFLGLAGCANRSARVSAGATDANNPRPLLDATPADARENVRDAGAIEAGSEQPDALFQAAIEICDGSPGLRFVYQGAGGGKFFPGGRMLRDFPTLYIDGMCHVYVAKKWSSGVRSRTLSRQELEEFATRISINRWPDMAGTYCDGMLDGRTIEFWVAGYLVRELGCGTLPQIPALFLHVQDAIWRDLNLFFDSGQPSNGAVWYSLLRRPANMPHTSADEKAFRGAPVWDSSVPIDEVATGRPDDQMLHRADGEFASGLRAIRDLWLDGKIGRVGEEFVPIVDGRGGYYELRMKDATPFDADSGYVELTSLRN